jgi:hypothetical protein
LSATVPDSQRFGELLLFLKTGSRSRIVSKVNFPQETVDDVGREVRQQKAAFGCQGKRGPFFTSPLGANFDPRGEIVPQG